MMRKKKIKKTKVISLKIEPELLDLLNRAAEKEDRSLSQMVRIAIKEYLRKRNEDNKL